MNIVSREEAGLKPPKSIRRMSQPAKGVYIHHTAGQDPSTNETGAAQWRSIQRFHQNTRGWHDIGYSFGLDPGGRWYEGRGTGVIGAHTAGHNSTSLGLVVMGNFERNRLPDGVVNDLAEMIVWLYTRGHLREPKILGGHRDVGSTTCPGANLYAVIPQIRKRVTELLNESDSDEIERTSDLSGWQRNVAEYALRQVWFREPTDWSRNADQFMVSHVGRKVHLDLTRRLDALEDRLLGD